MTLKYINKPLWIMIIKIIKITTEVPAANGLDVCTGNLQSKKVHLGTFVGHSRTF